MTPDPKPGDEPADEAHGGEAEIDDQPLGVPEELEPEEAPLPGLPEKEPPSSG